VPKVAQYLEGKKSWFSRKVQQTSNTGTICNFAEGSNMKLRVSRSSLKLPGRWFLNTPHPRTLFKRSNSSAAAALFGKSSQQKLGGAGGVMPRLSFLGSQLVHVIFSLERGTKRVPVE
jgi:hypothetical protein